MAGSVCTANRVPKGPVMFSLSEFRQVFFGTYWTSQTQSEYPKYCCVHFAIGQKAAVEDSNFATKGQMSANNELVTACACNLLDFSIGHVQLEICSLYGNGCCSYQCQVNWFGLHAQILKHASTSIHSMHDKTLNSTIVAMVPLLLGKKFFWSPTLAILIKCTLFWKSQCDRRTVY